MELVKDLITVREQKEEIEKITKQKDKRIEELEVEKKNNIDLQKEHMFYKQFFNNYFQIKKTELGKLRSEFSNEERE